MPYVKKEKRSELDKIVNALRKANIKADGDLNYVLFKYCKYFVEPSYNNYKNFCGELQQCAVEIERKLLGPYEDTKEKENGSI